MKKPIIAIDGYSSTGKSSISKAIAKKLGLVHIDTGALYRGITLFAIENYKNNEDEIDLSALFENLDQISLEFRNQNDVLVLYLNNQNITNKIRSNAVVENVSRIAKQKEVRDFLLEIQQKMAENGGVVMDGRDIGTVILPNADFKFFLTASIDERARRRYEELKSMGIETTIESVKNNLINRDKIDSERSIAPLKKAEDAILIDNTALSKKQTVDLILSYIK